jgi:hypothetical protein
MCNFVTLQNCIKILLAVVVLPRLQIKYCPVHSCGWPKIVSCVQKQLCWRRTESNGDFLAVLTCLRNGDTSQAAGPFKERRVCVDGLTGVVKCSDVWDCWHKLCITIMRFLCAAWWSQNAWRETVKIKDTFNAVTPNSAIHFTKCTFFFACRGWRSNFSHLFHQVINVK